MITWALILALAWPADCEAAGNLYQTAAELRDSGMPRELAVKGVKDEAARKAVEQVYDRPELSPREWRYFVIGVCLGSKIDSGKRAIVRT